VADSISSRNLATPGGTIHGIPDSASAVNSASQGGALFYLQSAVWSYT
jgi:hypothetical protein